MASASSTATTGAAEERKREEPAEMVHKTKLIQFLGRTTPIILQNDNGPCPLLAICNVLLLRNSLNLSPDIPEVSQEKLLSLVAERLIDSNSNVNDKDAGYVENQQQNIADAIDLLPRLTTGIDVNIKFRRIDDFEFTRECAIFDLLDIPLYHGWIVDTQDHETANAINSKSYNTLMGELVALETQNMKNERQKNLEDDSVDFVAATTAALGVPSPSLSRGISFDDTPVTIPEPQISPSLLSEPQISPSLLSEPQISPNLLSEPQISRKGDLQEEAELMRVLKLSESESVTSSVDDVSMDEVNLLVRPQDVINRSPETNAVAEVTGDQIAHENVKSPNHEPAENHDTVTPLKNNNVQSCTDRSSEEAVCSSRQPGFNNAVVQPPALGESLYLVEKSGIDSHLKSESSPLPTRKDFSTDSESNGHAPVADEVQSHAASIAVRHDEDKQYVSDALLSSCSTLIADSKSSVGETQTLEQGEALPSSIDGTEPLYEGEDCILEPGTATCKNDEPIYEGEVVLSEQVDRGGSAFDANSSCQMTSHQGDVVRNFLKNSASQLTIYGLFCLQAGIKERELCVFFRNNHFNTMFKFEGELYILVTDQGYINQPDLVWEKLNEVNGDTIYMTGNFKEFKVDNHTNSSWDEQKALACTADYLANVDTSSQDLSTFNSDLQLAIALQQQEFDQQQSQRTHNVQQETIGAGSRLVTGPQRSSTKPTSSSSSRPETVKASKDKCSIM